MKKNTWTNYWNSVEFSILEKLIQKYKSKIGYEKLLNSVSEIENAGNTLEIGAGRAWISQLLRKRGWNTSGIDLNKQIALSYSSAVNFYIVGDMFKLPFKENSFDLITSCGLIEHFRIDTVREIVLEMARVGKSVVAWYPTCGLEWKFMWAIRNLFGGDVFTESYQHKERQIFHLFKSLGFKNIKSGRIIFGGIFSYIYIYGIESDYYER